ncbi:MAG TPA: hypothetical protein VGX78_16215 [Pirellulales bacterium]|nr:hypothetical protein [Pirellulales bacterium]
MTNNHSWPLASHFSTILQNPRIAFRSVDLKQVAIEKDNLNQPRAWSGAFATVYKGSYPNGRGSLAVRVFTTASAERRERYHAIAGYLQNRRVESLVGFTYDDDGIRSAGDGKWYPLVTMEWVPGETLFKWTRKQCLNKNRAALAKVADLWIELIKELTAAKIAHGDLQHANVMVTDQGRLKLVDYDCMCVPALVGRKNLEIGVDPYQHPQRDQETPLSPRLDNFSALFILLSLRALAAAPELWNTYVEAPQYDKLLLRREDLDLPKQSPLIKALGRSPDAEVQRLCQRLLELVNVPLGQVPGLDEVLFSFAQVRSLLDARDFGAAIELLKRNGKLATDAPAAMQPRLREAAERARARERLEQAVAAGDEEAMLRLYVPKLLDDYPQARTAVSAAKLAGQMVPLIKQLAQAVQNQAWRKLVETWDRNQALLAGRTSAVRFEPMVRAWRERNQACDVLLAALKPPEPDTERLAAAWQALERAGGHPDGERERQKVERLLERGGAWSAFQQTLLATGEQADQKLVAAWHESLFAHWAMAERQRQRVVEARARLRLLDEMRREATAPVTESGETWLVKSAAALGSGYQYDLHSRVHLAKERLHSSEALRAALHEPISDRTLTSLWEQLGKLGGQTLAPQDDLPRIVLAAKRTPILCVLEQIPPDYQATQAPQLDARLMSTWNDDLLADCHDAAPWRTAHERAQMRRRLLAELKTAVDSHDKLAIAQLVAEPCLDRYPLPTDWQHAARQALAEVKATRKLLKALKRGQQERFSEVFDARILRHNATAFAPRRALLREWIAAEVLPLGKLGLAPPLARQSMAKEPGVNAAYRICWQWPEPRFTEQCVVAVCPAKPRPGDDPRKLAVYLRLPIDRKSYEEGGGSRLFHAEDAWLGGYVAIWAMIDTGFEVFASEPLILGRLEAPPAREGRGMGRGIWR